MRVLLTGGAGFIGSHLADALLARGDEVLCLDNFDPFYPRADKEDNISGALLQAGFRLVEGDVRDGALVRRVMARLRPDVVVHLAAKAGVRPSVGDPLAYVSVNVEGTGQLLQACRDSGVRKLLFASSSSVYGDDSPSPFSEELPANRPASPYAATKKACEELVHAYHRVAGIDAVCLRYFTVYGPRQRPEMAIHKFARCLADGRPVPVYGGGRLRRDYTYISDAIAGTLGALDHLLATDPCFEIVNLANGRTVSLDRLLEVLQHTFGTTAEVSYEELPLGDVALTWADVAKARRLFGYEPQVNVEEGMRRFAEWYLARAAARGPAGPPRSPTEEPLPAGRPAGKGASR